MSRPIPTQQQAFAAYRSLRNRGVDHVGDLSLGTLVELSRGSPSYAPHRYTDAEVRLAWHLLVLGWEIEAAVERVSQLDEALDRIRRALELPEGALPSDVVAAVEQLVADDSP